MWEYAVKTLLTVAVVIAVAEVGRRSSFWGAVIASVPLTSLLAFVWLYLDTGSTDLIVDLSRDIFWLVLASLPLFLVLPALLRAGVSFWASLGVACLVTVGAYAGLVWALARAGVRL